MLVMPCIDHWNTCTSHAQLHMYTHTPCLNGAYFFSLIWLCACMHTCTYMYTHLRALETQRQRVLRPYTLEPGSLRVLKPKRLREREGALRRGGLATAPAAYSILAVSDQTSHLQLHESHQNSKAALAQNSRVSVF